MNFDLDGSIAVLERTPHVLRALLLDLPEEWSLGDEGADTWSPFDVVGHLIDGEEKDWLERARIILAQGENPVFEPFDRFRHLRVNRGKKSQISRVMAKQYADVVGPWKAYLSILQ